MKRRGRRGGKARKERWLAGARSAAGPWVVEVRRESEVP